MASPTANSFYFGDLYSTDKMRRVFCDENRIRTWLRFEGALAKAQAACGVVPEDAAVRITQAAAGIADSAELEGLDLIAMRDEYINVGFPISPFVTQLKKAAGNECARWIHWGATTQDVIDTGLVLQMREGLVLIESDIKAIVDALASLASGHRNTVMAGRTFRQQAAPITFGFKAAVWLDEMLRHRLRLPELKRRALVCQYGGAVGVLAFLGKDGLKVREELAKTLELGNPEITWHTARDGWAELIHWLAMVAATLAKIANEIATLMSTEIGEVREPYAPGRGASSAMPQKRNPIAAPPVIAIAHRLRECVGSQLSAMIQENERALATQPLEWLVIPEAFVLLSGALMRSRETLENLDVDADQMKKNLDASGGFLMAESVTMGLADHLGRSEAHKLVSKAANRAIDAGRTLREELLSDTKVMEHLTENDVDRLLDPAGYLGCAGEMIDAVLGKMENE